MASSASSTCFEEWRILDTLMKSESFAVLREGEPPCFLRTLTDFFVKKLISSSSKRSKFLAESFSLDALVKDYLDPNMPISSVMPLSIL